MSTNSFSTDEPAQFKLGSITTYQSGMVQSAAHRALKKLTDDCLKTYDLTTTQWFIIGAVLDAGPKGVRITDLAKQVGTTLPFLTTTINLLVSRKILTRTEHKLDNRARMVTVSKGYRSQCAVIETALRNHLRQTIYSQISPTDLSTYLGVLYKLKDL